eukprot:TRINITY_DN6777_c0_g1_i12.p1 TRINITY_DN6777_c0_g1~~TRINITY_DN6777_c0_g1_i12.p1  ORF type:complete len:232 (-),score=19.45 TRINITY_DN6777_c0_g1_i12:76-771(-)
MQHHVDRLIRVFEGHTNGVNAVQFSPHDPDEILSGSDDGTVRLWRKRDGHLIREFRIGVALVTSVQFSPHDPDEILTGSADYTAVLSVQFRRLWRKSDGTITREFEEHQQRVNSVQFNPHDPDEILTGSKSDGRLIRVFEGWTKRHTNGVNAVQFSPHDPDEILSGSDDGTVRLWRKRDGHLIREFRIGVALVTCSVGCGARAMAISSVCSKLVPGASTRPSSAPTTRTRS